MKAIIISKKVVKNLYNSENMALSIVIISPSI